MATKMVLFDGDDTLWVPLSGLWLSDRTPDDSQGWEHFAFAAEPSDRLLIRRDDDALFRVRPEAYDALDLLRANGVLTGVASYNHEGNVRRMLAACGLLPFLFCVKGEWHRDKGLMLEQVRAAAQLRGHLIRPRDLYLVDDDYYGIYEAQCATRGFGLINYGRDITDLRQVAGLVK